jgi:hypothetical protein
MSKQNHFGVPVTAWIGSVKTEAQGEVTGNPVSVIENEAGIYPSIRAYKLQDSSRIWSKTTDYYKFLML